MSSLRLQYLETAYLVADIRQALAMLAIESDDLNLCFSCTIAIGILDAAVESRDLTQVASALAHAARVLEEMM